MRIIMEVPERGNPETMVMGAPDDPLGNALDDLATNRFLSHVFIHESDLQQGARSALFLPTRCDEGYGN